MDKILIGTAQNVTIEYEIAGVGERILATIFDFLIISGYITLIAFLHLINLINPVYIGVPAMWSIASIPIMFYNLSCETFLDGQSFGKKLRKIKVVKVDGTEAGISNFLLRWLFRIIDVLPYGVVATITIILNKKGQRLGDMAAGTTVIKIRESTVKAPIPIETNEENYTPVFNEAIQLTDKDIVLINQALQAKGSENYHKILGILATKLKSHLNIVTKKYHEDFLTTLVKDFNYYHNK